MFLTKKGFAKRLAYRGALLALALLVLLALSTIAGAQPQKVVTVAIRDFYFEPSQLTIAPGTTVQWVNEGSTQHTVFASSPAGAFLSGPLAPGDSFTYTFPQKFPPASPDSPTKSGTYEYYCQIHPDMKGSITFGKSSREAPIQNEDLTVGQPHPATAIVQGPQETTANTTQQPSTAPIVQAPQETTTPEVSTAPSTGGLNPALLVGLPVALVTMGALGWVVKRRSSPHQRE